MAASKEATKKTTTKKKATAKRAKKAPAKAKATKASATRKAAEKAVSLPAAGGGTRALVVVESPTKAKTLKKYLGRNYTVKASVGHIKDLPKSTLAVDLEHDFMPQYETIRGKSKVLKEIKDAARDVSVIYLAPDPDREGEAIAWHLKQELGKKHAEHTHRITFNEITKQAVLNAIEHPRDINERLFASQQARRVLDRIVGYQISPILWEKVRRGLSAGRVQSVAVRLIVERETAVLAFQPEPYFTVEAQLAGDKPPPFVAKVVRHGEEKFRPQQEKEALAAVEAIKKGPLSVAQVIRRQRRRRPQAPLITSKLQQEAAGRLRFTAKRTMMIAQQLYEGVELGDEGQVALITYMRTDSPRVAPDALTAVREFIGTTYGKDALPEEPVVYRGKKAAQDAHEAIRPTSLAHPPHKVRAYLTVEQFKLYGLIWRFFVASQMQPAVFDQTSVDISAGAYTLRATGSIMISPGFLQVHQEGAQEEQEGRTEEPQQKQQDEAEGEEAEADGKGELPVLEEGATLNMHSVAHQEHFTQPPPRFSESSLVRELEESGIGRPSTYATIMSTIVTRGYVTKDEHRRFIPTELGTLVTELLTVSFPQILDVAFTAHMEDQLDEVETGAVNWVKLVGDFYNGGFKKSLDEARVHMRDVKTTQTPTEHKCEDCGNVLNLRWGRNGSFLACSDYPTCRNTRDFKRNSEGKIEVIPEAKGEYPCPTCGKEMLTKRGRYGQFYACANYPECKGTRPLSIGVDCPSCKESYISERRSKRGRTFYGCAAYPACTFVSWERPVKGPCPSCQHGHLVRKYTKKDGVTIRCPNKECDYSRDPELDDEDAQAVAG